MWILISKYDNGILVFQDSTFRTEVSTTGHKVPGTVQEAQGSGQRSPKKASVSKDIQRVGKSHLQYISVVHALLDEEKSAL